LPSFPKWIVFGVWVVMAFSVPRRGRNPFVDMEAGDRRM
jgi:hypothetical protein